jgi:multiple sugar transport system permease protein
MSAPVTTLQTDPPRRAIRLPTQSRTFTAQQVRDVLSRYAFVLPAVLYLIILMLYPIGYTAYLSVYDVKVSNFLSGGADFVGFANYVEFVTSPTFLRTLGITFAFTLGSLAFQHAIGFAFALFFNKGFPLAGFLRALMLVVWVLPAVVAASLWRWMYSGSYGVINAVLGWFGIVTEHAWLVSPQTALLAVIVANIWLGIPFHMLLLYAGLQGIPRELYEATSIDGASRLQQFRNITVPLMRPVILTTLLLGFVHTFKAFDIVYVMTSGGPAGATSVLPIGVYQLSFDYFRLGEGAAAANVLLFIPLVLSVIYLWLRRREDTP